MHLRGVRISRPVAKAVAMATRHYGIKRTTDFYDRLASVAVLNQRRNISRTGQVMNPTVSRRVAATMIAPMGNIDRVGDRMRAMTTWVTQSRLSNRRAKPSKNWNPNANLRKLATTEIEPFPREKITSWSKKGRGRPAAQTFEAQRDKSDIYARRHRMIKQNITSGLPPTPYRGITEKYEPKRKGQVRGVSPAVTTPTIGFSAGEIEMGTKKRKKAELEAEERYQALVDEGFS
jgi:hypothetical protein